MVALASSMTVPSGSETTAATAAGPGLPRAPPSRWRTSRTRLLAGDGRELARHPGPAPVAALALVRSGRVTARAAAVARTTVDDHGDVRVIGVVVGQLLEELTGELLGHHAIDHRRRC